MRIIGNIEHPQLKITVFKMDNRLSVKFEAGLYEQTYKFRDGDGINTVEDVERLVNQAFMENVLHCFERMHRAKQASLASLAEPGMDEFEHII